MTTYQLTFSPPDQYGEISARLVLPLSMKQSEARLMLSINGGEAQPYLLTYADAGTVGYARGYAVQGRLTNIGDWSKGVPPFAVLNVIGTVTGGEATLMVWKKAEKNIVEKSALFQE